MQASTAPIPLDMMGLREHFLTLTDTQRLFAQHVVAWSRTPRKTLIVLTGGPGTGKSYVVHTTLDYLDTEQLRMSYTARSAQAIGGQTIHSAVSLNYKGLCLELEKQLANEQDLVASIKASRAIYYEFDCRTDPTVVVFDEVSMVNGWLMYWLIRYFMDRTERPLLLIAIGDPHQLNPVMSTHNLFSFTFSERRWAVHPIHLKESKRFVPEYEKIINRLRTFVDSENESGLFAFICHHFPVCETIDGTQLAQANRAMASRNERAVYFNHYYIKNMVKGSEVTIDGHLILKPGCIVFVTQNNCSSVTNGTELEFIRYRKIDERIICKHPKTKKEVVVRRDSVTKKFPVVLGFAGTIHKFQGGTLDCAKIVIDFEGNRNLNMAYTALSRVRQMGQILAIRL